MCDDNGTLSVDKLDCVKWMCIAIICGLLVSPKQSAHVLFISSLIFYYGMSNCFLIAPLNWDLRGGRFRAADVHLITGVIPSYFQYDARFQAKSITVHEVSGHYIYTKFYHVLTIVSNIVVDYSPLPGLANFSINSGTNLDWSTCIHCYEIKLCSTCSYDQWSR